MGAGSRLEGVSEVGRWCTLVWQNWFLRVCS